MMQEKWLILSLIVYLQGINGQEVFSGTCNDYNVHVVQNFDAEKYSGLWYEVKRYETIFEYDNDCAYANYTVMGPNLVRVVNRSKWLALNWENSISGIAFSREPEKREGKLKVQFPLSPEADYWIIGTDYEHYSIVWACFTILLNNLQFLWVLSRTRYLSDETAEQVDRILNESKLDATRFRITNNNETICKFDSTTATVTNNKNRN